MSSSSNNSNFKYVLIPAIESEPISACMASKSGGLTNDELSKNAKQYFFEKSGGSKRAELLEAATTIEKKQIANKIREQYSSSSLTGPNNDDDNDASSKICAMDDEQIISLLKVQETSTACEITCLTIPTPVNGQTAVSMYGDDTARTKNLPYNQRATNLMMAAGHAFPQTSGANVINDDNDGKQNGIYGDVFVGRCIDDEVKDIWERIDILPEEVGGDGSEQKLLNNIEWCKVARKKGGGGGQGGKQAASLSNTLKNFSKQQNQIQQQQQGSGNQIQQQQAITNTTTMEEEDNNDNKYTWTQTDDEIEIKFIVPNETKSKNVKVKFGNKSLKVSLVGITTLDDSNDDDGILCDGELWDEIDIEGSTFTLQNENSNRELCISLEKSNNGQTWNYVIEE
jgi:hypothetical protein